MKTAARQEAGAGARFGPRTIDRCVMSVLVVCAGHLALLGCGQASVAERMSRYRGALETVLDAPSQEPVPEARLALPARRDRRLEVSDQRIGPFDFLSTLGCPLSELVAARNSALGKVLVPTRRLAHELAVVEAIDDCLPTLSAERAERLGAHADAKRAEAGLHVWNAVWLDRDLERFLSTGPASLIGFGDPSDGPEQMARAAEALGRGDVETLESAFHALRDNPPLGQLLADVKTATEELERAARLVSLASEKGGEKNCGAQARRLSRVFASHYRELQPALAEFDRSGREALVALESLFRTTALENEEMPAAMQRYRRDLLGGTSDADLAERFRTAIVDHAKGWGPILERCGVIPGGTV